ncbi:hypothetical protein AeRB84_020763 [Aphanomyces euteiches]|nr:hypothetical protein AeRB84_020763 [Aphanomyces euteiches]
MGRRSNSSPSTSRSRSRERRDSRDSRRGDRRDDRYRSRSRGRDSHDDRPIPQSLLVRGIPNSVTIDVLREKFSRRRGDIRDVYVPKDHATGEPRGFAFIEFKDIREARDKSVSYLRNNAAKLLTKCVAKNSKRVDLVANHNAINVVRVLPRVRVPRRRNIYEIEIGVAVEAIAPSADIALETNKETP